MHRELAHLALASSLLIGCAAGNEGDTSGTSGSRQGAATATPSPGSSGTAGADAPAMPSTGYFGNSGAAPAQNAPMEPLQDESATECEVGVRCAPTEVDPDDCGSLTLESEVEVIQNPGNVLLVFDRSGSMAQDWNNGTRWEIAGQAIENALTPLTDMLTIGSVFFPSSDPNAMPVCIDPTGIACIFAPFLLVAPGTCDVNPITEPDQIDFAPGADFINTFVGPGSAAPIYAPVPMGLTPLREGLEEAQRVIASSMLTGITSVVIITDGDPNCEWDAMISEQIVTDWQAQGIRTYVVGLPGVGGGGQQVLNALASAGGTGQYLTPDNPADLEQALRDIATETVRQGFDSCEIVINPPAEVPDKLHLVVTEGGVDQDVPRELSDDAGWAITDDGSQVTLDGTLCEDAMEGRFEALRFEFGCVDLPPLVPRAPD